MRQILRIIVFGWTIPLLWLLLPQLWLLVGIEKSVDILCRATMLVIRGTE